MAELIHFGTLAHHARKARRIYEARRNLLIAELREKLGGELDFETPSGGLAIWTRLRPGRSAETWASTTRHAGLLIVPGSDYVLDPRNAPNAFRIGFAKLDDNEIRSMVSLLAASKPG
jgi:GntR family transcriptional regulator/MocR family aminotransferase